MANIVYKWRVYCTTDEQHEHVWAETEPIACPIDPAHTIDSEKTAIVGEISENVVEAKIKETSLTAGRLREKGWGFSIPATAGDHDFTAILPYSVDAVVATFICKGAEDGDHISVVVSDGTVVGLLNNAAGYSQGDEILTVDSSVIENTVVGHYISFAAATDLHVITAMDPENSTITVEQYDGTLGLKDAVADNSAIKLHVFMADQLYYPEGAPSLTVGSHKIGASGIPARAPVKIIYYNSSNTAKMLRMNVELLYGNK